MAYGMIVKLLSWFRSRNSASYTSDKLRNLYHRYGGCMAFIAIENSTGHGIGTAFHVGDGVFVTARHVLEGAKIDEIRLTDGHLFFRSDLFAGNKGTHSVIEPNSQKVTIHPRGILKVCEGPFFHPDEHEDVACFRVEGMAPGAVSIPLGGHLDDWIGQGDFELSGCLVLGYPPVPFTREPLLIAVETHINAVVDVTISGKSSVRFVLSAIPRGGFSGGVAISEYGFALGLITESLLSDGKPTELGYFATTSIESIYVCLEEHKMVPSNQVFWHSLSNGADNAPN
jgi:hypothetical protein